MSDRPWLGVPGFDGIDLGPVRIGGPGLGNLLFPWARCAAAVARFGGRLVWPTWTAIKPARILRCDPDQRWYGGLFVPPIDAICGCRAAIIRLGKRPVQVVKHHELMPEFEPGQLYVFRGMTSLFAPLWDYRDYIRNAFFAMCRAKHLASSTATIAIHVRLGDFARSVPGAQIVSNNTSIPIAWYRQALETAMGLPDAPAAALVYSDGTDEELATLLADPRVRRAPKASPVRDLTAMARSPMIITSNSTYSMWAAFLSDSGTRVLGADAKPSEYRLDHINYLPIPI